jgi:UDP-N-acetylglucosamine/UDP-N-acetylgalactosamine 4-epimerase
MSELNLHPKISQSSFLVTGGAGFIGSNIVGYLLKNHAKEVRVLDNFSTGYRSNVEEFLSNPAFSLIEGDITSIDDCIAATADVDYVLHQAALGSVPRSIANPLATNAANIDGFLNMLHASVQSKVKRFVYASSSSVYGDDTSMPKEEHKTGQLLSPYAVTKKANELYASVFFRTYGLEVIGLRYFNVFGPKQNINGPYAAVIPIFINEILNNRSPVIFGDGTTTRDFTYVGNVVDANILAAMSEGNQAVDQVYNIAFGGTISLNRLFKEVSGLLDSNILPEYQNERKGDIKNSHANIEKAKLLLKYEPRVDVLTGLRYTVEWYKTRKTA